jgi:hypothetical protein
MQLFAALLHHDEQKRISFSQEYFRKGLNYNTSNCRSDKTN